MTRNIHYLWAIFLILNTKHPTKVGNEFPETLEFEEMNFVEEDMNDNYGYYVEEDIFERFIAGMVRSSFLCLSEQFII